MVGSVERLMRLLSSSLANVTGSLIDFDAIPFWNTHSLLPTGRMWTPHITAASWLPMEHTLASDSS